MINEIKKTKKTKNKTVKVIVRLCLTWFVNKNELKGEKRREHTHTED